MKEKITSFRDLKVWQKAHNYVLEIYQVTRQFPSEEKYGLGNQLQRAGVSITSHLAEGFYRRTRKDKVHYYTGSLSSLGETQNQLILALDLGYITKGKFYELERQSIEIQKMLNGLIKSSSEKP